MSLFRDGRQRRRAVRVGAAACAGVAAVGAFLATQATAQDMKNVMVYTDQSTGCVWVGDLVDSSTGNYISTGHTAGWQSSGIQVMPSATVTVKTYSADCATVKSQGDYSSRHIEEFIEPSDLNNVWLNTTSAPTGTLTVTDSAQQPGTQQFIMFSNRSGRVPDVCFSVWYAYYAGDVNKSQRVVAHNSVPPNGTTPNHGTAAPPDEHTCVRVGADAHHVFRPQLPGDVNPKGSWVHVSVNPSGTAFTHTVDFDLDGTSSLCIRETSSGTVHQATDKPCTPN
ncbi:MAG: hypothetical protein JO362_05860 [Streptomycetaceae bacterium]|nr:hypothetical protein [Streptomycetaceae bacterium]